MIFLGWKEHKHKINKKTGICSLCLKEKIKEQKAEMEWERKAYSALKDSFKNNPFLKLAKKK